MQGRWAGETVVCIASGPSLTQADVDFVRDRARVIVCNTTFLRAPWADVLYAADRAWWRNYTALVARGDWPAFAGERWGSRKDQEADFGVRSTRVCLGEGLSAQPGVIHSGGNGGYQLLGLAYDWGASRIVMLGYDMQRTGGQIHHHGPHPETLTNPEHFGEWIRNYQALAADLERRGVDVVNCTRETALTCFRRAALEEALR